MRLGLLSAAVAVLVGNLTGAATDTRWTFSADPGTRIPAGVSTEVLQLPDGSLLAYVGTLRGELVYRSTDGLAFTEVSAHTPAGNDPAIVGLPDGRYRMYFNVCNPCAGADSGKEIRSAVSSDGLNWTTEPGVRLVEGTFRAGGVPDAVVLPDGRVRIYYLPSLDDEGVASATSLDGLTFTADPGYRLTGGYVDPAVLRLPDGTWLMVVSRTPREQQRLYLARSTDGLAWTVDPAPVLQPAARGNALDPTLLPLPDGRIRVYYSAASAGQQLTGPYTVESGVLAQVALHTLTVAVTGKGTVTGASISCPGLCKTSLEDGARATLTARPARGYRFARWSGACAGTRATCALAVRADAVARATFAKQR